METLAINKEEIAYRELLSKHRKKEIVNTIIPFTGLIFIIGFFAVVTKGNTISLSNLTNLVNQSFTLIIVAVAAVFVYAHGGIDMSVGAVQGFVSVIIAMIALQGVLPGWTILPIGIGVGMFCGFCTGSIHVLIGVPAFVVSLCVNFICTGIVATACANSDIYLPYAKYGVWNNLLIKGVVLLAIIGIGFLAFEYTKVGKYLKAIGGNMNTAKQSGVVVKKYVVLAYTILGGTVGLIAFFALTRTGAVTAQTGSGLNLDVLTAIVLGGFPLVGGAKSRIRSAVVGALTVTVLSNGLTIWGVDPNYINGIQGILFLIIVAVSYERKKGEVFN
jgi:ribose transport system permease protein